MTTSQEDDQTFLAPFAFYFVEMCEEKWEYTWRLLGNKISKEKK